MSKYRALSCSQMNLSPFQVSGGPLATEQTMGWHIVVEETGLTAAVSNDHRLCARLNALEVVASMFERFNLYHLISNDLHDTGLWDVPEETWQAFKEAVTKGLLERREEDGR